MLPDVIPYVPDPKNGRPIADGQVFFLLGSYTPPGSATDVNPAFIAEVTADGIAVPQPIFTSKGGTLLVGSQSNQPQLEVDPLVRRVAVYDKCGRLVYSTAYNGVGPFVSADALAANGGAKLVGFQRSAIADAVLSTIDIQINSLEYSILEFKDFATKPDANDPTTWDWTLAFTAAAGTILALGGGSIRIPKGRFKVSSTGIDTTPSNSYYRLTDKSLRWAGEGVGTVLTRNESLATDIMDFSDPAQFHNSVFNLHNSNNIIENLTIENAKSAIYMGQINGAVDTCHSSFNKIKNVWIVDCGVGIHIRSGNGCYYNSFEDMHVWQCQVGEYLDKHPSSLVVAPNVNRNQFRMVRNARCQVGLWVKAGDTNQFIGQHNEGNTATPTNNRYPAIIGLPYSLSNGVGQLLEASGINNQFVACMQEDCDVELVNAGERNSFSGLYRDETAGKVRHIVKPIYYSTRTMFVTNGGATYFFANTQSDIFAGFAAGVVHNEIDQIATAYNIGAAVNGSKYSLFNLGALASSAAVNHTIWADAGALTNISAVFDVTVLGTSIASNLVHTTSFKVIALRNSSRTLTRYYVFNQEQARATGANTGDLTEPFTPMLSVADKDLVLTLTAPARAFTNVMMKIESVVAQ